MDVRVEWDPNISAIVQAAAIEGLNRAAAELLGLALELVPYRTGDLSRAGTIQPANGESAIAYVVFNIFYAVHVHEGVGMTFSTTKNPNAQAKFLENPAIDNEALLVDIVGAAIRRALR